MAKNFLEKSPTYLKRVPENIRRRRGVVCDMLNEGYSVPHGVFPKIVEAVRTLPGFERVSAPTVRNDASIFRLAFRYLAASAEDEERFASKVRRNNPPAMIGISSLISDNFHSFEDFPSEEAPTGESHEDHFGVIESEIEHLRKLVEILTNDNQTLEDEVSKLKNEKKQLEAQLTSVRGIVGYERSATLHVGIVNKDIPEPDGKRQQALQNLATKIPRQFNWLREKGRIVPDKKFVRVLFELPAEDQKLVLRQVKVLAEKGATAGSLQTKKIYGTNIENTPAGSFFSRASGEIRFTWAKKPNILTLLFIIRRGDTGWSEA